MFDRVQTSAISLMCNRYSVPLPWALGVAETESGGRDFWPVGGRNRPAINLEGHYFDKYATSPARAVARRRGLCNPVARKTNVPTTFSGRYDMLHKWMLLDEDAALMSISMGVGQVMGVHWKRLGFASVQEMWATAQSSLAGQVELMLRFIATDPKLMAAVNSNNYAKFARLYNGPAYRTNKYDTKIKAAVQKFMSAKVDQHGPIVKRADTSIEQKQIADLGYPSVEAFQSAKGLTPDNIIGPITVQAIQTATATVKAAPAKKAQEVAIVVTSGAAVISGIEQVTKTLDAAKPVLEAVKSYGVAGPHMLMIVAGGFLAAATVYVSMKGFGMLRAKLA